MTKLINHALHHALVIPTLERKRVRRNLLWAALMQRADSRFLKRLTPLSE